jgi:hypothetical protein
MNPNTAFTLMVAPLIAQLSILSKFGWYQLMMVPNQQPIPTEHDPLDNVVDESGHGAGTPPKYGLHPVEPGWIRQTVYGHAKYRKRIDIVSATAFDPWGEPGGPQGSPPTEHR